jgi:hypothetical protein
MNWIHRVDPRMPGVAHGWKLHVSPRPATLEEVVARVLPVLDEYVCHVKYARNPEIRRALNSGFRSAGAIGKAVTVHPVPGAVVEIASALVEALNGIDGPRVLRDMRVSPTAPVSYRYGPFEATDEERRGHEAALIARLVLARSGGTWSQAVSLMSNLRGPVHAGLEARRACWVSCGGRAAAAGCGRPPRRHS